METINTYLENMFKSLPNTDEVRQLKEDLYSNMEDKYNELKDSGKSENEAIGIVISEFGNIDELTSELGLSNKVQDTIERKEQNTRIISIKEAKGFIDDKKRYGLMIAIGVWLCIFAVNSVSILNLIGNGIDEGIGLIPFFVFIACAVGLFIYSGSKLKKYEYIKEEVFDLDEQANEYINNLESTFQSKFIIAIIVGVTLCILSVTPVIAFEKLGEFYEDLSACMLIFIVSIAVFIFAYFGNVKNAFSQLLQIDDYSKKKKENNKVIGIVASVVFPIAALVYILVSMLTDAWNITWIIWPTVGILFGAFSSAYSATHDKNNKKTL